MKTALSTDELHLGELLRDRAPAFNDSASGPIRAQRTCDTPWVDAPMTIEASVLDAEDSANKNVRKFLTPDLVGKRTYPTNGLPIHGLDQDRGTTGRCPDLRRHIVRHPDDCAG